MSSFCRETPQAAGFSSFGGSSHAWWCSPFAFPSQVSAPITLAVHVLCAGVVAPPCSPPFPHCALASLQAPLRLSGIGGGSPLRALTPKRSFPFPFVHFFRLTKRVFFFASRRGRNGFRELCAGLPLVLTPTTGRAAVLGRGLLLSLATRSRSSALPLSPCCYC